MNPFQNSTLGQLGGAGMGNPLGTLTVTTTGLNSPGFQEIPGYVQYGAPITPDHRDEEIKALRTCLHEAYAEIGRLHEQVRGMQAFDKWSEGMAKQAQP